MRLLVSLVVLCAACRPGPAGSGGQDGETGVTGATGDDGRNGNPPAPSDPGRRTLLFEPAAFPMSDTQKREVLVTSGAEINGVEVPLGYTTLLRSADESGNGVFGLVLGAAGAAVTEPDGSDTISDRADFTSLHAVDGDLWALTQFGGSPGALYLTDLRHDAATGEVVAQSTEAVDVSSIDGLWNPSAGSRTPWGTHLAAESIHGATPQRPTDGRAWEEVAMVSEFRRALFFARYHGLDIYTDDDEDGQPDNITVEDVRAVLHPYRHGFPIEMEVGVGGAVSFHKHLAMGRMSLEHALVMPDERTVFLSDEDTNGTLFLFVADTAGDLSSGELFAPRWHQTSGDFSDGGAADIEWLSLGHASRVQIQSALDDSVTFDDLFATADPILADHDGDPKTPELPDGTCPAGFVPNKATGVDMECLALVKGAEVWASRLEPTRYAAWVGATTELNTLEGLAHDPLTNTLYAAISVVERGMEPDHRPFDLGGADDIRLARNACGAIYAARLVPSVAVGSDYVPENLVSILVGTPTAYPPGTAFAQNTCAVDGIANPDGLTFVDGYDTLIIGEDSAAGHQNDAVFALGVSTGQLQRIQTTP
ncbi:MAG: DUF839 domain-containing protein [Myxococcales bacterium]|nr:DUF839 domain-containing protein [Myxococcales bacterium]